MAVTAQLLCDARAEAERIAENEPARWRLHSFGLRTSQRCPRRQIEPFSDVLFLIESDATRFGSKLCIGEVNPVTLALEWIGWQRHTMAHFPGVERWPIDMLSDHPEFAESFENEC